MDLLWDIYGLLLRGYTEMESLFKVLVCTCPHCNLPITIKIPRPIEPQTPNLKDIIEISDTEDFWEDEVSKLTKEKTN